MDSVLRLIFRHIVTINAVIHGPAYLLPPTLKQLHFIENIRIGRQRSIDNTREQEIPGCPSKHAIFLRLFVMPLAQSIQIFALSTFTLKAFQLFSLCHFRPPFPSIPSNHPPVSMQDSLDNSNNEASSLQPTNYTTVVRTCASVMLAKTIRTISALCACSCRSLTAFGMGGRVHRITRRAHIRTLLDQIGFIRSLNGVVFIVTATGFRR